MIREEANKILKKYGLSERKTTKEAIVFFEKEFDTLLDRYNRTKAAELEIQMDEIEDLLEWLKKEEEKGQLLVELELEEETRTEEKADEAKQNEANEQKKQEIEELKNTSKNKQDTVSSVKKEPKQNSQQLITEHKEVFDSKESLINGLVKEIIKRKIDAKNLGQAVPIHILFEVRFTRNWKDEQNTAQAIAKYCADTLVSMGLLPNNNEGKATALYEKDYKNVFATRDAEFTGKRYIECIDKLMSRIANGGTFVMNDLRCLRSAKEERNPYAVNALAKAMEEGGEKTTLILFPTTSYKEITDGFDEREITEKFEIRRNLAYTVKVCFESEPQPERFELIKNYEQDAEVFWKEKAPILQGKALADYERLKEMAGFADIRNLIHYLLQNKAVPKLGHNVSHAGVSAMHMAFVGHESEERKRELAKLLADFLIEIGALPGNDEKLIEVSASDLIGIDRSDYRSKMEKKLKHAKGGILYIKDIYHFINKSVNEDSVYNSVRDSLGRLSDILEDYGTSILVILAGSLDEVGWIFDYNRRLRYYISHIVQTDDILAENFYSWEGLIEGLINKITKDKIEEQKQSTEPIGVFLQESDSGKVDNRGLSERLVRMTSMDNHLNSLAEVLSNASLISGKKTKQIINLSDYNLFGFDVMKEIRKDVQNCEVVIGKGDLWKDAGILQNNLIYTIHVFYPSKIEYPDLPDDFRFPGDFDEFMERRFLNYAKDKINRPILYQLSKNS